MAHLIHSFDWFFFGDKTREEITLQLKGMNKMINAMIYVSAILIGFGAVSPAFAQGISAQDAIASIKHDLGNHLSFEGNNFEGNLPCSFKMSNLDAAKQWVYDVSYR